MGYPKETLDELALSEDEYRTIVGRLGREPNLVELGMFGALWSEHCGYKHSKALLRLFPRESPRLVVEPGAENAGVVDLGDGLVAVMKVESHNHPSAIEPFQGAATGVGGIVRDVFSMGARPMALLNSLRFGPPEEVRNRYLFEGVVSGISWYGNCIGVPNVGGEVAFAPAYSSNPLVNAMCVGVARKDDLVFAGASGDGNLLVLIGADTGRDGIHGASGLASRTLEEERELRSAVQVGNPFLEKVLIEACLEIAATGTLVGMQDLGAAGLTSSVVECAARGGSGAELDLSRVPRRETGMSPYEVMLSESQERMLLVVRRGHEGTVKEICEKWDLAYAEVGRVSAGSDIRLWDGPDLVAELPTEILMTPPLYSVPSTPPPWQEAAHAFDLAGLPLPDGTPAEVLLRLLSAPTVTGKRRIYRQYDHQVQTNTVVPPGLADAAVLRLRGTRKGIALTTDGNGRLCYLDPYAGGAIAVAEATRNLTCAGAEPVAITDCLNFGDPEKPHVAYQFEQCVRGMSEACRVFGIPVVSGNVSFYNETRDGAVYPTPVVGALGLIEDVSRHMRLAFRNEGDVVVLLGTRDPTSDPSTLAGSEYLWLFHGVIAGKPQLDLKSEARVQRLCRRLIQAGTVSSAHDCSDGGLAVALAESTSAGKLGFTGEFPVGARWDADLFGEAQSRIIVSLSPAQLSELERTAAEEGVPWVKLGTVGGDRLHVGGLLDLSLEQIMTALELGLEGCL